MAFEKYTHPWELPEDPEEAFDHYLKWFKGIEDKRDSSQAPIIPIWNITPIISVGEKTRYFVTGGYSIIPKGYTPQ